MWWNISTGPGDLVAFRFKWLRALLVITRSRAGCTRSVRPLASISRDASDCQITVHVPGSFC